jgi:Spy/CpxP family protein refolding chaperone
MSEIKKSNRFSKWAIGILIVLNLITLSIIALQNFRWKASRQPEIREDLTTRVLSNRLNFDEAQVEELRNLRRNHFERTRPISQAMHQNRQQLYRHLKQAEIDSAYVDSLAEEMGLHVSRMEKLTFQHFNDIKGICQPDQVEKFNQAAGRITMLLNPQSRRIEEGRGPKRREPQRRGSRRNQNRNGSD